MTVHNKFKIGEFVYLITDEDQYKRIIIGIIVRSGYLMYEVSKGSNTSWHYEIEMTADKQII